MESAIQEYAASAGDEPYLVHGRAFVLGRDVVVLLWGGVAHVGAAAMAQPRPSIRDASQRSATSSVLTLVGHCEDVVVKMVAERMAAAIDRPVVAIAGLHWDYLPPDEITKVLANCERWVDQALQKLKGDAKTGIENV